MMNNERRSIRCVAIGIAALVVLAGCSSAGSGGSRPTYTVTYEANNADDGTAPSDTARYEEGAEVTILGNTGSLMRDEYPFFVGWNSAADGTGEDYFVGDTFAMPAGDLTLYALWLQEEKVLATDGGTEDYFGAAVAIDGDYAIVGATEEDAGNDGYVYIYRRTGGNDWDSGFEIAAPESGNSFGRSVAIAGDHALIGAPRTDNINRSVHAYRRTGLNTWSSAGTLSIPDVPDSARGSFGTSIAMDGSYAVVGDDVDDEADSNAGAAHIYRLTDAGVWEYVQKLTAADEGVSREDGGFGASVAIDGDYLIVGATGRSTPTGNRAYIFQRTDSGWSQIETLDETGVSEDDFGGSVAISGDYALVGASWTDNNTDNSVGAAYLYRRTGTDTWTRVHTYTGTFDHEFFGGSVALEDDTALVGSSGYRDGTNETGALYIFRRDNGDWDDGTLFLAPDGADGDAFGVRVAADDRLFVVGASWDDENGDYSGSAYIWRYR